MELQESTLFSMEKTNWIIVKSRGRGVDYGVGTFVRNMLHGLQQIPHIEIFVLEIGGTKNEDFYIDKNDGITYFHFNKAWHTNAKDTVSNLSKHAKNTLRVLQPYIPKHRKTVIHLNFIYQYFLGKEFRDKFDATVICTQHVFTEKFDSKKYDFDLETGIYQIVDHVITVTKHGKDYLKNRVGSDKKITPIYNGINPDLFNVELEHDTVLYKYGLSSKDKFILYSGRLDPIKGLKYFAEAFKTVVKEIPDCRLVVAGNGNYEELINACKEVSSNVNYLGFIPFDDLVVLYKKATIGVIPSLEEHCSYVALEMLHSGLPVVASNLGGLKEIFIHNENALLVDTIPDSTNVFGISPQVGRMSEHIITLLKNEELRNEFSESAIKRANNEFTSTQMAKKYVEITLTNIKVE